ncbi:MAG TPA: hypothetical protein PKC67_02900 [Kiritimatiellia bacterium]|nr:hypothetical protein [Kiritimatiellia bacterium]HMP33275.1 hypothetical protein [Kiritimatiellia bacterium]
MSTDKGNAPQPGRHTGRNQHDAQPTPTGTHQQGYLIPVPLVPGESKDFAFRSGTFRIEGDADTVIKQMIRCNVWESFAPCGLRPRMESVAHGQIDGRFYLFIWKADALRGTLQSVSGPDSPAGVAVIRKAFEKHIRDAATQGATIVCGKGESS